MHSVAPAMVESRYSLEWIGSQGGLLTYQEYLLYTCLDVLLQEKRLILRSKLNALAEPFFPWESINNIKRNYNEENG